MTSESGLSSTDFRKGNIVRHGRPSPAIPVLPAPRPLRLALAAAQPPTPNFRLHSVAPNPQLLPRLDAEALSLLVDPPADGAWNMAVDEALLETIAADQCILRFYQWKQPTLSLGYFQTYEDRCRHPASCSCAVVRRASGGGAILHDVELTYSFIAPASHPWAVNRLRTYQAFHRALIETLADWGIKAALCVQPLRIAQTKEPFLCFQRRAEGDVLVDNAKIAGSAQRRSRGAVLQHGSILLGQSAYAPELPGIAELTGRQITAEVLATAWLERLVQHVPLSWKNIAISSQQRDRAAELADTKYKATAWTQYRGRHKILPL